MEARTARSDVESAPLRRHLPTRSADLRATETPADVAPHEVEHSLKHGAIWALGTQVASQAIRFGGVIVLARLLSPSDYGAAALALAIASYSIILGDLGYGGALIQAESAPRRVASTAFWASVGAGAIGTACVALAAYPIALALGENQVALLAMAGGLTLLIFATGSASNALLARAMRFDIIQGAGLVALIVATAAAVTSAALGAGPWALVLQQLVLSAVTSAIFIVAARWRPSPEFSRTAFRSMTKFAMPRSGGHLFAAFQTLISVTLIGSFVGIEELGIWNLSMSLVLVPLVLIAVPVAQVIYAAFARMREDVERVAEVWLTGFSLVAAIALPVLLGLVALAPMLIPLVFGSQWASAVPVVQILSVWVIAKTLQTWNTSVMDAAGKPHVSMILNLTVLIALPPSLWVGSQFGIAGAAVAFSLAELLLGEVPSFIVTTRQLRLKTRTVLRRVQGTFLASAVCFGVLLLVSRALADMGLAAAWCVLLSVAIGSAVYFGCLAVIARDVTRQLLGLARGFGPALRPST
jgi:O-antigen/teichoic acid export membrane protein